MRLLVFGASSPTGRHVVEQALRQDHEVTAFIHHPSELNARHAKLHIINGHVLNPESVKSAIKGHDAVLCCIEHAHHGPTTYLSDATANIINAMEAHHVKRLVCLSTLGVLGSDASLLHKHIIIPLFRKHEFADKRRQVELIMQSDLDWVVVRSAGYIDTHRRNKYHVSLVRPIGGKLPGANVADFMLKQVGQNRFLREMPIVSG